MHVAVSGFVSEQSGSVASANALLLRELLDRGCRVTFFSKPDFVDPRPAVGDREGFAFRPVVNALFDSLRRGTEKLPGVKTLTGALDSATYNRLIVREMAQAHRETPFDLCLWLGEFARGRVAGVPSLSFVQGPPGTDARSLISRRDEIARLAGEKAAQYWSTLAKVRLSPAGLPPLAESDAFIVGSRQSAKTLADLYAIKPERIAVLPYPIDLALFQPGPGKPSGPLRVLWLGRIVPRKRLDVFLEGLAEAVREGCDVRATVAGDVGFVPGYDKMIESFPYPERLDWRRSVPRAEVPDLFHAHDVLAQPSDEENFGSSVAEAQACGLPVIVGRTNGNADYLSPRDIHLADDRAETFAGALREMARRKATGTEGAASLSRRVAETNFSLERIADRLLAIMNATAAWKP